uniref:IRG-type G domain-containing protein n=1 Tax=Pelodiscus sinensis TaxID=13735 RepID=K7F0S2_PELSI
MDLGSISALMKGLDLGSEPKDLFNDAIKVFEEFVALFQDKGQADVASIAQAELQSFESTVVNIAVTGETGAGKSSFINALRGLTAEDDGAAPTGVTETTKQPTVYPHPNHPKVRLWDLPGIGGPDFHPCTYLRKVNFKSYDFFVIVASERFTCSHTTLAQEIGRMGKRFYFVRSKVDDDLRNEERDRPRTFRREMVLQRLQADCRENLQRAGMSHPEIFLLSSCDFTQYDAPALLRALRDDLPSLQRLAFLLSLPNLSADIIKEKKASLQKLVWLISLGSALVNAVPIPQLSVQKLVWLISLVSALINAVPLPVLPVACDIAFLLCSMISFYKYFGLDDGSLAALARQCGKPIAELKAVITSPGASDVTRDRTPVSRRNVFCNHLLHDVALCQ